MRQLAGKLLLLVVTLALLWTAGEIVLRRLEGGSDDTALHTSSADPFVPRLIPDTRAMRKGVEVRTNALGLRGPEIAPSPPEGVRRVLCLGDSYTFGTGVEETETIPARLDTILGEGVEVVNLGIEGANAYDSEARLRFIGLDLHPDLVVLFYLFNDVYRMERGRDWMAARTRDPEAAREGHLRDRRQSLFLAYLRSRVGALVRRVDRSAGRLGVWNDQYRDEVPAWIETRTSLLEMRDMCKEEGVPFVVAVLPAFAHFTDEAYPLPDYRREVAAFCQDAEIPVVDLHEPFWGSSGRRYWISPMDPHPNAAACARIAGAVAARIDADGLLGPEPGR
jgi:lysophospholipase L1-like esterase